MTDSCFRQAFKSDQFRKYPRQLTSDEVILQVIVDHGQVSSVLHADLFRPVEIFIEECLVAGTALGQIRPPGGTARSGGTIGRKLWNSTADVRLKVAGIHPDPETIYFLKGVL